MFLRTCTPIYFGIVYCIWVHTLPYISGSCTWCHDNIDLYSSGLYTLGPIPVRDCVSWHIWEFHIEWDPWESSPACFLLYGITQRVNSFFYLTLSCLPLTISHLLAADFGRNKLNRFQSLGFLWLSFYHRKTLLAYAQSTLTVIF